MFGESSLDLFNYLNYLIWNLIIQKRQEEVSIPSKPSEDASGLVPIGVNNLLNEK